MKRFLLLLLIVVAAVGCVSTVSEQAKVARVIDGDTIEVVVGGVWGVSYKVRYIGIDTPELDDPDAELRAIAVEAKEKNRELVAGKVVHLERDQSETDRYGRLLRYVYVDGCFVNAELVRLGYAWAVSYPPDTRHQKLLSRLEQEAREAGRGLWGTAKR